MRPSNWTCCRAGRPSGALRQTFSFPETLCLDLHALVSARRAFVSHTRAFGLAESSLVLLCARARGCELLPLKLHPENPWRTARGGRTAFRVGALLRRAPGTQRASLNLACLHACLQLQSHCPGSTRASWPQSAGNSQTTQAPMVFSRVKRPMLRPSPVPAAICLCNVPWARRNGAAGSPPWPTLGARDVKNTSLQSKAANAKWPATYAPRDRTH